MTPLELITLWLQDAVWSGIAAAGFAVLFNVPRRLLVGCFIAGATGHTARTLLMSQGLSIEGATLIGATLVGFLSVYLSGYYAVPASSFTVTGAIPMVPGVFAYQTMMGLLNTTSASGNATVNLFVAAGISGMHTALILSAIAFGITAPALVFRRPTAVV